MNGTYVCIYVYATAVDFDGIQPLEPWYPLQSRPPTPSAWCDAVAPWPNSTGKPTAAGLTAAEPLTRQDQAGPPKRGIVTDRLSWLFRFKLPLTNVHHPRPTTPPRTHRV